MTSLVTAAIVLACAYAAALLGTLLHRWLPEHHLDAESRDVVKLVMGLVATMAALVLGLLVASANAAHEQQTTALKDISADIILLDRTLALYGPDAQPMRAGMHAFIKDMHDKIWSPTGVHPENLNSVTLQTSARSQLQAVAALTPATDMQRALKAHAFDQVETIGKQRLLMFESYDNQIPLPFLAVLIFWISMLFLGFGLLASFNPTVAVAQFLGALSVAGSIFLILELNQPYAGPLQVSDAPLRAAIAEIDRY